MQMLRSLFGVDYHEMQKTKHKERKREKEDKLHKLITRCGFRLKIEKSKKLKR